MKLFHLRQGVLELQWAWLPYWLAANPNLRTEVEREVQDALLLNGITLTEPDADLLSEYALKILKKKAPGAAEYLDLLFGR